MKTNKDRADRADKLFWVFALCVSIVLSLVSFGLTELYIFLLFKDSTGFYNWNTAIIGILGCLACWWAVWCAYDNLTKVNKRS